MKEAFQLGLVGLSSGSLIAIAALGLVLVYRGSGIINFSQGAVGTVSAFVFWEADVNHHWGGAAAFMIALVAAMACGYLTHKLVMKPMRHASGLAQTIATLAVLVILQSALTIHYGPNERIVQSLLPRASVSVFGVRIGEDRFYLFLIAVVLVAGLWFVYGRTSFGRATSAVAENVRAASSLGISPSAIARNNWVIGSLLAGLAGILLSPILGVQIVTQSQLIIPVLAAALVGGLRSFPMTFVGGLLIGVSQAEVTRYVTTPGWSDAVPFLLILIIMAVRGNGITVRSKLGERQPLVGDGRVRALPLAVTVVVVIVAVQWWLSIDYVTAVTVTFSFGLILLSSVVVTGYAGQLSLCQFSLAGAGAVIAGHLVLSAHLPFLAALVVAALLSFPAGLIVGLPVLRTRGVNLAVATLGFAVAIQSVLLQNPSYTGGQDPTVPEPTIFGWSMGSLAHPRRWALFCFIVFIIVALGVVNLRRGRTGRRLVAVRANERAAQSLGVNPYVVKLYAFSLAASIAAIGGILVTFQEPSLVFTSGFDPFSSINGLVYSVLGGIGFVGGPILGGLGQPGGFIPTIARSNSINLPYWIALVGSLLTVRVLQVKPDGAAEAIAENIRWLRTRLRPPKPTDPEPLAVPALNRVPPKVLVARDVAVAFGGVVAVDRVSLEVRPGEIVGLIGPNGAGKTTLIDALTGLVRPREGTVELDGRRIDHLPMHRRVHAGLGRSFQSLELFDDMSVGDNLAAAADDQQWTAYVSDLVWPAKQPLPPAAAAAVRIFELDQDLAALPTELPYGRRRLVAIARAISAQPSVVCLDEPAAGLSTAESRELGTLLRRLAKEIGMGILLVEHDVELVMSTCDRIVALEFGRTIAEGTPTEIRRHPAVIKAYLGGEDEETGPVREDPSTTGIST